MEHKDLYADDAGWTLEENSFDPSLTGRNETLFSLANGNLGLRGTFDEGTPVFHSGTYINGFFEREAICYGERAYGFAEHHETLLNLPDIKTIRLRYGALILSMDKGELLSYKRSLDFRTGILTRCYRIKFYSSLELEICSRRLVSFVRESLAAIEYSLRILQVPPDAAATLQLESLLDASVYNRQAADDPRIGSKLSEASLKIQLLEEEKRGASCIGTTRKSGLALGCNLIHSLRFIRGQQSFPEPVPASCSISDQVLVHTWSLPLEEGLLVRLYKYASYHSGTSDRTSELIQNSRTVCRKAAVDGFETLLKEQSAYLHSFWQDADIELCGAPEIQQAIRFNIFHILQSAGRNGKTSLAAKGLSGEGYEGHYFWDTEIYVCPLFTYTRPELARSLLEFRYTILPKARDRARIMSEKGALFPWRTIDGDETSAYFPAGTAQYHINADIVYAMEKYCNASGDDEFRYTQLIETAVETARLWVSLGHFGQDGRFRIQSVTGPDEYTALVDNNCYTNLMAANNLLLAARLCTSLQQKDSVKYSALCERVHIQDTEVGIWEKAAKNMYVPYDKQSGIYPQDDSFMSKEVWDFDATPKDKYPLLLYYHPLVIYRHKVLKQPDLVLAQFLLSEQFTRIERIRNYRYYEPLTTGDSSLSHCVQSIIASDIGETDAASHYFNKTVRMDLDDIHGNSCDGIHTAAMAGSWMSILYGFCGFRDRDGFSFDPRLPPSWSSLRLSLRLGNMRLRLRINQNEVEYIAEKQQRGASELYIKHRGSSLCLRDGIPSVQILKPVLRAVLFDLDGVITDTAEYHYRAWKRLCDENGWRFDKNVNEKLKGISRLESLDILLEHNGISLAENEYHAAADKKNRYYVESLKDLSPDSILPGIQNLLSQLGKKGIRRILASASRNAPYILKKLGLDDPASSAGLDAIVDPTTLLLGKPDPEIFLAAADLAGAYYLDCIGIEDAQAGIDAIKAAGIRAVAVGRKLEGADTWVSDTRELTLEFLEKVIDGCMSK